MRCKFGRFMSLLAGLLYCMYFVPVCAQITVEGGGGVAVGASYLVTDQSLEVHGGVVAGVPASATWGVSAYSIYYSGDNVINTIGSMYSSASTLLGYGVRPKYGSWGFVSSAGNAPFPKGALELSNQMVFRNATAATVAIGNDVVLVDRFIVTPSGFVGIGMSNPAYLLHVAGTVRASSFISDTTTYADFVFKPGYRLAPLPEVEKHIAEHGHLPDIPNELDARQNGIDLAAMQVTLLQKIEELTLHAIAQEKRIQELEFKLENRE